jgi:hypothetical protein
MLEEKRIMSLVTKMPGLGLISLLAVSLVFAAGAGDARAATPRPHWSISVKSVPTNIVPGQAFGFAYPEYYIRAVNVGNAPASGPITITDVLPDGLTSADFPTVTEPANGGGEIQCVTTGQRIDCVDPAGNGSIEPGQAFAVALRFGVDPDVAGTLHNEVTISGGGAADASAAVDSQVSATAAAFDFLPGSQGLSLDALDADAMPAAQAGSHPDQLIIDSHFPSIGIGGFNVRSPESLKDYSLDLPPGMVVNPQATPVRCTEEQLESDLGAGGCPLASQVGTISVEAGSIGISTGSSPLYNMVPSPDQPAQFGFDVSSLGIYVHLAGGVDAQHGYALTASSHDINAKLAILGFKAILWGNPADPVHDANRGECADPNTASSNCPRPSPVETPIPFLTMPSACSSGQTSHATAGTWQDPGDVKAASFTSSRPVTGCDQLDFSPTVSVQPDNTRADSPTGLDVDIAVPQPQERNTLAEANLKAAKVVLPQGMAINPSTADGLDACSPAQIGLGTNDEPTCPDASKVGTVEVDTPLLPNPLEGSVYVAKQNDNPFNSLLAIYVVAEGQGLIIKLAGKIDPDPDTGQLVATFKDNPQIPFADFKLTFKGGDRGPLVSPATCGHYTTSSEFTPWSAADPNNPTPAETVTSTDSFQITSGPNGTECVSDLAQRLFNPGFSAGTTNPQAGAYSPFVLRLTRSDGEQNFSRVDTTLPPGLLGKLAGVAQCSDAALASISAAEGSAQAEAANSACPADSLVGSTSVGAGVGSSPLYVSGKAYLAGPYKDAPFSLALVTPAVAGPFDLGTVVVRAGLYIDPITAQVTVKSDPIPTIIDGIPLRIRDIRVNTNRPDFTLNPTSCDPTAIGAQAFGSDGAAPTLSTRFQAAGCAGLGLSPKLAISLTGKGQTTDGKHPGVSATVSQKPGQANLKKVQVALPLSLALDPDNANGLCEFVDGSKVTPTCPKASIVGTATAVTPILDQPLSGPVYFVKNIRKDPKSGREIRTLPKLVIPLTGQNGLKLTLTGTSNVVDDQLVTTFDNIPDAPVSSFKLDIIGGKGGILTVSGTDICKATQVADQQVDGQNGKTADASVYLQTPACPLKVLSKKVGKTSVAVKVGGLSAGKVTVSGKGIKKTRKTIAKSTVATITAKRTKGKPGKVTVSFDPTGPAKARKTTK